MLYIVDNIELLSLCKCMAVLLMLQYKIMHVQVVVTCERSYTWW